MPTRTPTRRTFCFAAVAALLRPHPLPAQTPPPTTHPNLREIDRDRILAAANRALARSPAPGDPDELEAFLAFTQDIPALAAAHHLAPDPRFAAHALPTLVAWFTTPTTRVPTAYPTQDALFLSAPLAEIAVALPFLGLAPADLALLKPWFTDYLTWLTESRPAQLARDSKTRLASSWLLQVAAIARLTAAEATLSEARRRFKTSTIRAQIDASGFFPHEVTTPDPYRNSLFNLDLLAGAAVLLSTRFESVWDHELPDGPGMHAAIARHAPYLASLSTWPYPADSTHFHDARCRRPALLFAGRAFNQSDYTTLWRTLDPDPTAPEILHTFPIRQPILWENLSRTV